MSAPRVFGSAMLLGATLVAGVDRSLRGHRQRPHRRLNDVFESVMPPVSKYIVGGDDAPPGEYPWFATPRGCKSDGCCGDRGCWGGCGAVLIARDYVLTAAHCFEPSNDGFRLESYEIGTACDDDDNCGQRRETVGVDLVSIHPDYGTVPAPDATMPEYDFAVVRLAALTEGVDPIDVDAAGDASSTLRAEDPLTVIGLGRAVAEVRGFPDGFPSRLQEATLGFVPDATCSNAFPVNFDGDSMMCVLDYGGKSSCAGDSGGPLFSRGNREDEEPVLVGVSSWGTTVCRGESPSVFAEVSSAADWFGPIVCSVTTAERRPPPWCGVCERADPPSWCGEVVIALDPTAAPDAEDTLDENSDSTAADGTVPGQEQENNPEEEEEDGEEMDPVQEGEDGADEPEQAPQEDPDPEANSNQEDDSGGVDGSPELGEGLGGAQCGDTSYHKYCSNRKSDYCHCTCYELSLMPTQEREVFCRKRKRAAIYCSDTCAGKCSWEPLDECRYL